MNKCIIENCGYFSNCCSGKCSIHKLSPKKLSSVKIILDDYQKSNESLILTKTQERGLLNMFRHISKDDPYKLEILFKKYLSMTDRKYISSDLAREIVKLLSNNKSTSYKLIHIIYPYVIDRWNIDKTHFSPAFCYYGNQNIDSELSRENYFKTIVEKDKFKVPIPLMRY